MAKNLPKYEHLNWAKNDATHHPSQGMDGYFTSMDIIKIFPEVKMDALQEWFRRGDIRPVIAKEGPTGWIKQFNRSGLCMIGIFKRLVDFGIQRDHARSTMIRFHNGRIDFLRKHSKEPDYVFFEEKGRKHINEISMVSGDLIAFFDNTPLRHGKEMGDLIVINFFRMLAKIDSYSR
jgi:hypothetical protein